MRERSRPPFRADHVGSLLRPHALKAARREHAAGLLDSAGLAAVEDREILGSLGVSLSIAFMPELAGAEEEPQISATHFERVRSSSATVRTLIAEATERSATFRDVITRINATDGVVLVEEGTCPLRLPACLPSGDVGRVLSDFVRLPGPRQTRHRSHRVDWARAATRAGGARGAVAEERLGDQDVLYPRHEPHLSDAHARDTGRHRNGRCRLS